MKAEELADVDSLARKELREMDEKYAEERLGGTLYEGQTAGGNEGLGQIVSDWMDSGREGINKERLKEHLMTILGIAEEISHEIAYDREWDDTKILTSGLIEREYGIDPETAQDICIVIRCLGLIY
jgi:hypothetical protein